MVEVSQKMKNRKKLFVIIGVAVLVGIITVQLFVQFAQPIKDGDKELPRTREPVEQRAQQSDLNSIDRILTELELGNIAFNAPNSINLYDTAIIQLILGIETSIDELKEKIEEEGERVGAQILIADRMEARLYGRNFDITAISPETQAVSHIEETEWIWEIQPLTHGPQRLYLTLSALISVEGESTSRMIRTFNKAINVEVTWLQRTGTFFSKNWQWLWVAILAPGIGWYWKRKQQRKSNSK